MKAIRVNSFGGPDVLHLEDALLPAPGPGQVVIAVKAVGVNPVDTYLRAGQYPKLPPLPFTPGTDAAGVVEAVGDGVTEFKTGDRVYTAGVLGPDFTGTYAEKLLTDVKFIHLLPDNITFEQGAGIYVPYATAYFALWMRARGIPHETVLVHGASGGVGTAAVQIASAAGFRVAGTASTPAGREHTVKEGAHAAYDHSADGYLQKAVEEFTGGKGFDIIIEMLANVNLASDLTAVGRDGRIVVVGNRGMIEVNLRDAMSKNSSILGMSLPNATLSEQQTIHAALHAGLTRGTLRPTVSRSFALSDAGKAHEAMCSDSGARGKIILTI